MNSKSEKIRIFFVYQVPSFWITWERLYQILINDNRFDVKLLWIYDCRGDAAQTKGAEEFLIRNRIKYEVFDPDLVIANKPDFMVYQTPYDGAHRSDKYNSIRYKRLGIRIVYLTYGIEISDTWESRYKHFSLPVINNADAIYTMSDEMKKEYDKWCVNYNAVRALGLPRFDALTTKYEELPEVKRQKNGRLTILWKVHFPKIFKIDGIDRQVTPDLDEYIRFVEYIEKNTELFFVFMPHPKFADDKVETRLRKKANDLLDRLKNLSNVFIDWTEDYRNSLTNADAIMIDRSAVMVEAGLMDVPVMYLHNNQFYEPLTAPVQRIIDSYEHGTNAEDMIAFCEKQKAKIDNKREIRESVIQDIIQYCDGHSSERIRDDLIKLSNEPIEFVPKKIKEGSNIVIWGAGEMGMECISRLSRCNYNKFNIVCMVDSSEKQQGTKKNGIKVISPHQLENVDFDFVVIATEKYYREVYLSAVEDCKVPKEKVMNYDEYFNIITLGEDM